MESTDEVELMNILDYIMTETEFKTNLEQPAINRVMAWFYEKYNVS